MTRVTDVDDLIRRGDPAIATGEWSQERIDAFVHRTVDHRAIADVPPRRHARRARGAAALAAAGLLGLGVGTAWATHSDDHAKQPDVIDTSRTPLAPAQPGEGAPAWLPPGAELTHTEIRDDGSGSAHYSYSLPGPANRDAMDFKKQAADPRDPAVHPATSIEVTYAPAVRVLKDRFLPSASGWGERREVDVNGARGVVLAARNGLGVHRVDWVDDDGYHVVMCDRIRTETGRSGVGVPTLLRIARSV